MPLTWTYQVVFDDSATPPSPNADEADKVKVPPETVDVTAAG
ncbi:hypothetical protein Nizo3894_3109 [Lactiplantibacillus plantarum]|nr:hypothetical protein Nizo2262_0002 [Lactiplantibacillus plantarum]KZU84957.1 hypothetical protein Nizo3894_3109 [Lactiplantibacillus plantarum]